jgi:hypothetical protein
LPVGNAGCGGGVFGKQMVRPGATSYAKESGLQGEVDRTVGVGVSEGNGVSDGVGVNAAPVAALAGFAFATAVATFGAAA